MSNQLDPNTILSHEFEYAAQTAFQANEDRVRVFNYYLATVGTMIAASVLGDLNNDTHLTVFALAIAGLAFLGFISLLKLAKLRIAWADSVRAMCLIKKYYVKTCSEAQLKEAFLWTGDTIPSVGKKWTVAFLMAVTIAVLSSASAGGVVLIRGLAVAGEMWGCEGAAVGFSCFVGQMAVWHHLCRSTSSNSEGEQEKEVSRNT